MHSWSNKGSTSNPRIINNHQSRTPRISGWRPSRPWQHRQLHPWRLYNAIPARPHRGKGRECQEERCVGPKIGHGMAENGLNSQCLLWTCCEHVISFIQLPDFFEFWSTPTWPHVAASLLSRGLGLLGCWADCGSGGETRLAIGFRAIFYFFRKVLAISLTAWKSTLTVYIYIYIS